MFGATRRGPLPVWPLLLGVPLLTLALTYVFFSGQESFAGFHTWAWFNAVKIPARGQIVFLSLVVTLMVTRRIVLSSPVGPLTVTTIVDSASKDGGRAQAATAILRERIANALRHTPTRRASRGVAVVPSFGALDVAAEPLPATNPEDAYGLLTWLGLGVLRTSTQRLGWRIHGTIREREDTSERYGLSFVVEHVATGRHDLSLTVWKDSADKAAREAAYEIAAWRLQRSAPASTRTNPSWRPTAAVLRKYQEALHHADSRRFDQAVQCLLQALELDPSNLALRRLLGETYEWLGQFESALHAYASGTVLASDQDNGWSPSVVQARKYPLARWPWSRFGIWRDHRRSSRWWRYGSGLTWRRLVVMHFAEQWVGRWIWALEQDEGRWRRTVNPSARSWVERLGITPKGALLQQVTQHERDDELRQRVEQAKRLRGYFHHRYETLLEREYPLLRATWFSELHERRNFRVAGTATCLPVAGVSTLQLIENERDRLPVQRHQHRIRPRRTAALPGKGTGGTQGLGRVDPPTLADWIAEVQWFLVLLDRTAAAAGEEATAAARERLLSRTEPRVPRPESLVEVALEVAARLGIDGEGGPSSTGPSPADSLSQVAAALTDREQWEGRRRAERSLDWQQIGAVTSWAATQLLRIGFEPELKLGDRTAARILALVQQLDLRSFLYRASLHELDVSRPLFAYLAPRSMARLRRWGLGTLPGTLQDLVWLTARYQYLERLHRLAGHGERASGADPGILDPDDEWNSLRMEVSTAARRVTGRRARLRPFLFPSPDEWSVWYYAACVHALVIPERDAAVPDQPGQAPDQAPKANGSRPGEEPPSLWKRRYDAFAELSVRALNQAILVRSAGGRTLIEAGAGDWLQFEDPDLEQLRLHPRFERWVTATFNRTESSAQENEASQLRNTTQKLEDREHYQVGLYGAGSRWTSWSRRWWSANDRFLLRNLALVVPSIRQNWLTLAERLAPERFPTVDGQPKPLPEQAGPAEIPVELYRAIVQRAEQEARAWQILASYRRFAARTRLRLQAARRLGALADPGIVIGPFPNHGEAARHPLALQYDTIDKHLDELLQQVCGPDGSLDPEAWRICTTARELREVGPAVEFCVAAARRWEDLLMRVQVAGAMTPAAGATAEQEAGSGT